jgi:hypothetical protein
MVLLEPCSGQPAMLRGQIPAVQGFEAGTPQSPSQIEACLLALLELHHDLAPVAERDRVFGAGKPPGGLCRHALRNL